MAVAMMDRWSRDALEPGDKVRVTVRVSRRSDGSDIGFPVLAVKGVVEGATLCAIGGVHGDEFEAGEAIRQFWRELDPKAVRGTFVGIPTVNVPAFDGKHRASNVDHIPQDMGRMFPSVERGYLTGLMATALYDQIVRTSTAVIDMHSGGTLLEITPCVIFIPTAPQDAAITSESLARATRLPYLRRGAGQWRGTLPESACTDGIAAITTEIGGEGRCRPSDVALAHRVLSRVAHYLGLLAGPQDETTPQVVVSVTYQYAHAGGIYRPTVHLRDAVRAGEVVGTVADLFGDTVERVIAPFDGVVIAQRTYPAIQPGELTIGLGQVLEESR